MRSDRVLLSSCTAYSACIESLAFTVQRPDWRPVNQQWYTEGDSEQWRCSFGYYSVYHIIERLPRWNKRYFKQTKKKLYTCLACDRTCVCVFWLFCHMQYMFPSIIHTTAWTHWFGFCFSRLLWAVPIMLLISRSLRLKERKMVNLA